MGAVYLLGFLAFPPTATVVTDEAMYVRQAALFAAGESRLTQTDVLTGETTRATPSFYPPGTSLLQTPFVAAFGWEMAGLASVLSLLGTAWLLGRLLTHHGLSPAWALWLFAAPPVLVMGRIAMSDVPSMLLVTIAVWLFLTSDPSARGRAFLVGLVASLSLLFREPNVLPLAPFLLGAVLRREERAPWLVIGGLVGLAPRLLLAYALFGDPLFARDSGFGFGLAAMGETLPIYGVMLLGALPLGLVAVVAYRGPRWPELLAAVLGSLVFYALYEYHGAESGGLKMLVLGPRFLLPIVPLVVFSMAWCWNLRVAPRLDYAAPRWLVPAFALAVAIEGVAMHAYLGRWTASQSAIASAIQSGTRPEAVVLGNPEALSKFVHELYGERTLVDLEALPPPSVPPLERAQPLVQLVSVDRSDSDFWRRAAAEESEYRRELAEICSMDPDIDRQFDTGERVRVWTVRC